MRRREEKGTALLSVLLLVAVMAVIAATSLDRLGLSTRLAANAASANQSRLWLGMGEQLAISRLREAEQLEGRQFAQTLGTAREIELPDGQVATVRLDDATNCFNLNSLVRRTDALILRSNPRAIRQFSALLELAGIEESRAAALAARTADAIDSDRNARPYGGETAANGDPLPNRAFVSASEWTVVEGVDRALWDRMQPWLCALPQHELTPININTLPPDRAELISMLAPDELPPTIIAARLGARPRGGYREIEDFWEGGNLDAASVPGNVRAQVVDDTQFVSLTVEVGSENLTLKQKSLVERAEDGPRLRGRLWGAGI